MRKSVFFTAAVILAAAPALATPPIMGPPPPPAPPVQPKLVVTISVDQLSSDLWNAYRPHFTGGFKRLADSGVLFVNGYQSHAATETCPGHSTLLTGRYPSATGIVANNWVDQGTARADKTIYCAEDERVAGSTSQAYTVSAEHLKVSTLGDRLKAADPGSRNVAVAGKDRAAVMMSGRAADQRWFWNGKAWSSDLRGVAETASMPQFRQSFAARFAEAAEPLDPPALCQARATPFAVTPTLTAGNGRFGRAAGDARAMRASPELDDVTLTLAALLVSDMKLGQGQSVDSLSIGLSATDYVGHSFGWGGQEMCLQMLSLDGLLGRFLAFLDSRRIDYAVVLSADHGGQDLPERLRAAGETRAVRADPGLAAGEMGKLLAPQVGLSGPVLVGDGVGGDVWLDRGIPAANRGRVLAAAAARYREHPQVQAVFTAAELLRAARPSGDPSRWSLLGRVRAAFDPARSGDLYVVLKEHVSTVARPGPGYVASHGTAWDYDRRVPILFAAPGYGSGSPAAAADTADILPTVASLVGLSLAPGSVDGRCRSEAARCR
jgi:predicted AlkP superfamily pyrophosphatase or phosphodiesterase